MNTDLYFSSVSHLLISFGPIFTNIQNISAKNARVKKTSGC